LKKIFPGARRNLDVQNENKLCGGTRSVASGYNLWPRQSVALHLLQAKFFCSYQLLKDLIAGGRKWPLNDGRKEVS
jgi:hypothetical protein